MSYAVDYEIASAQHMAELGAFLNKIELPINRLKQMELWMEIGLLDSDGAALLTEAGYLFNRTDSGEER